MDRLEKTARILGDSTSGALLFHRQELGCTQCHTLGKGSKLLGPDLSTLGERATLRHIVESIERNGEGVRGSPVPPRFG